MRCLGFVAHLLLATGIATACQGAYMLELHIDNDSAEPSVAEILGPAEADDRFRDIVESGATKDIATERPSPGRWAVAINGKVATRGSDWPSDNPTIDLTLRIHKDGSVEVLDT